MSTVLFVASIILQVIAILLCAVYVLIAIIDHETIERTESNAPRKMLRSVFIAGYLALILSCVFDKTGTYTDAISRASSVFKGFAISWLVASVLHIIMTALDYLIFNNEDCNVKFLAKVLVNMLIAMFVAAFLSVLLH